MNRTPMNKTPASRCGIAIVAPGGYAPDPGALQRAIQALEQQGHVVHNYYDPERRHQRFGGSDAARLQQLHGAARDPDIDVVIALRGGYGMSRLLPAIDFSLLAESGKLFVGHSDITALQMGLLTRGASSFAGPMMCDDFTRADLSAFTLDSFWRCIGEREQQIEWQDEDNPQPQLSVSGTLWGGNLSMLVHMIGSAFLPSIEGGVLFLEDINEHPYRVERMLLQLLHAGVLGKQSAIVLGDFGNYRLSDYDNGYDFAAMLQWLRSHVAVPVVTGLPFGHIRDKATLAVGADAELLLEQGSARLTMRNYRSLAG